MWGKKQISVVVISSSEDFQLIWVDPILSTIPVIILQVASFLYYQEKMNVVVEPDVHDIFARIPGFGFVQTFYSQDTRYWSLWVYIR